MASEIFVQFLTSPIFVTQYYCFVFFFFSSLRSSACDLNRKLFCISLEFRAFHLKCACLIFCFTVGCSQLKHLKWFKERVSEIILYIVIITDVSFWQAYFCVCSFHSQKKMKQPTKEKHILNFLRNALA